MSQKRVLTVSEEGIPNKRSKTDDDDDDDDDDSTNSQASEDKQGAPLTSSENKMAAIVGQLHTLGDGFLELRSTSIGLGVFAKKRLLRGTPLTQYYGQFISWSEVRLRASLEQDSHIRKHIGQLWAIDGKRMADGKEITDPLVQLVGHGVGAYCNDAKDLKKINAYFNWVDSPYNEQQYSGFANGRDYEPEPEERVTYIVVGKDPQETDSEYVKDVVDRDIAEDEEICVFYGRQYWARAGIEKR
jgi:hypothetical protein